MSMQGDEIEVAALRLNPRARAHLAERLLQSLEALSDEENEALWIEEAQRRNQELNAGDAVVRPAEEVFREARSRLA